MSFMTGLGARFTEVNGCEAVNDYGDALAEHAALREPPARWTSSFRARLCVTGGDRVRFLNGQVTNNVKDLRDGRGLLRRAGHREGQIAERPEHLRAAQ